jgi:hypothetical protein
MYMSKKVERTSERIVISSSLGNMQPEFSTSIFEISMTMKWLNESVCS